MFAVTAVVVGRSQEQTREVLWQRRFVLAFMEDFAVDINAFGCPIFHKDEVMPFGEVLHWVISREFGDIPGDPLSAAIAATCGVEIDGAVPPRGMGLDAPTSGSRRYSPESC